MQAIKISSGKDLLKTSTKNDDPTPRMVFGKFIYENELSILFGDSNAGKTVLANEIGFFVSGGGCTKDLVSLQIPTLYIDLELTAQQFASRYHNAGDYIPDTFTRAEINMSAFDDDESAFNAIKNQIVLMQGQKNPPKFIIIDNITNGFGSIMSASQMRGLMTDLKTLKDRWGLTILLIAHCPKRRKNTPIEQDSLGGSKMIINFADSAFAIANTVHDENIKYLKQIKVRTGQKSQDVVTMLLTDEPYLTFRAMGTETEAACIDPKCMIDFTTLITTEQEIKMLNMLVEGTHRYYEIADECGIPLTAVIQYKNKNRL